MDRGSSSLTDSATLLGFELQLVQQAFNRNVARDLRDDRQIAAWPDAAPDATPDPTPDVGSVNEGRGAVQERTLASLARDLEGYKGRYLERFGTQLNADNASELFEEYAATLESRAVHVTAVRRAAVVVVDSLFDDLLAGPVPAQKLRLVVFTAGGNGSGKTSSLAARGDTRAHVQFDSTLGRLEQSSATIERAVTAGFQVLVSYVWRDPLDALVRGTLPRAMRIGRTVPLAAHARTHPGARQTILALLGRYAEHPGVTFAIFENASRDRSPRLALRDAAWLQTRPHHPQDALMESLRHALAAERAEGRIGAAVYQGTAGE